MLLIGLHRTNRLQYKILTHPSFSPFKRPTAEMVRDDNEESGWRKVVDAPAVAAAKGDNPTTVEEDMDETVAVIVNGEEVDMEDDDGGN
jgi:hypothetical protein